MTVVRALKGGAYACLSLVPNSIQDIYRIELNRSPPEHDSQVLSIVTGDAAAAYVQICRDFGEASAAFTHSTHRYEQHPNVESLAQTFYNNIQMLLCESFATNWANAAISADVLGLMRLSMASDMNDAMRSC